MTSKPIALQLALDFDNHFVEPVEIVAPHACDVGKPPVVHQMPVVGQFGEGAPHAQQAQTLPSGVAVVAFAPNLMNATASDMRAMETWIAARCDDAERDRAGRPPNTASVYRREARRFILWLRAERGRSLAEARLEDSLAYRAFLAHPAPREKWCAPRGTRVASPQWRPFEGPLCARARRQAITILSCLYRFLQDQLYLAGNPWSGVAMPRNSEQRVDPGRSLSREQWLAVEQELHEEPQHFGARQLAWAARFLYSTGLRLSEIAAGSCGDLRWLAFDAQAADAGGAASQPCAGSWIIQVIGKGLKLRDVPIQASLVDQLGALLSDGGTGNDPRNHSDRPLLLKSQPRDGRRVSGELQRMSSQSLYRQLKRLFARAAERMVQSGRRHEAAPLLRATTHWLRHTCGTHSVDAGVPLDVVSQSLGHSNLQVTSIYIACGDLRRRARESSRLALWVARR